MQLMIMDVPDRNRGLFLLERVELAVDLGRISVADMALVYRDEHDRVRIHQTRDAGATKGALKGGGLGVLLGLFAPPVALTTVAGAAAGAAVARLRDKGIDNKLMKRVGEHIEGATAAVFILADDATIDYLSGHGELVDYGVEYVVVAPEIQHLLQDVAGLPRVRPT